MSDAKALQKVERIVATLPEPPGGAVTPFLDLAANPDQYAGQEVTTQAYYFWSPRTSGLLAELVTREKTPEDAAGLDPMPQGKIIAWMAFRPIFRRRSTSARIIATSGAWSKSSERLKRAVHGDRMANTSSI